MPKPRPILFVETLESRQLLSATVSITAPIALTSEGATPPGRFTVTRSGDLTDALDVSLLVTGSATNGVDYGRIGSALTFAPGVASLDLPVRAVSDSVAEGTENVIVALGASSSYDIGAPSATVNITDIGSRLTWSATTPAMAGRAEGIGATINGKLYQLGGYTVATGWKQASTRVDCFDPATGKWTQKANMPEGIVQTGCAVDGKVLYYAGGYVPYGTTQKFSTNKVWAYDSTLDKYAAMPNLPAARAAGAMAVMNHKLYYVAGSDANRRDVTTVYTLNLDNPAEGWKTAAALPAARNRLGVAALNGKLYAIGGQTGYDPASIVYSANCWSYNDTTNSWSAIKSLPTARSHMTTSTFVYNNRIVTLAGEGTGQVKLKDANSYDPTTNTWTTLTNLPLPRFGGVADVLADKLIYSGGFYSTFETATYYGKFA